MMYNEILAAQKFMEQVVCRVAHNRRHGIELSFFSRGAESHESQRRTWISKIYPLEIFLKISYDRPPKRTVCFVEIVVFA